MFKNKTTNGQNNVCGKQLYRFRRSMLPKMSQQAFAKQCQLLGLDIDKNAVQRIECGKRYVTDFELLYFCQILNVSVEELLSEK